MTEIISNFATIDKSFYGITFTVLRAAIVYDPTYPAYAAVHKEKIFKSMEEAQLYCDMKNLKLTNRDHLSEIAKYQLQKLVDKCKS